MSEPQAVRVRRGETEFLAPDLATLVQWSSAGRIEPTDYILHPLFNRWVYARDVEELGLRPNFSPGVAALLSLVIPGAGSIYRGEVVAGIAIFVFTVLGYVFFVIPGIIMHVTAVIVAAQSPK